VDRQQFAMTREVNIGLNPSVPHIDRILKCFKRVLVRNFVATSVGYCKGEYMLNHISSIHLCSDVRLSISKNMCQNA
jgi:hypothetical protein